MHEFATDPVDLHYDAIREVLTVAGPLTSMELLTDVAALLGSQTRAADFDAALRKALDDELIHRRPDDGSVYEIKDPSRG